jgi:signal recognition particle GTPase
MMSIRQKIKPQKFICVVNETVVILCKPHAESFAESVSLTTFPSTIIELDDDARHMTCMACETMKQARLK